MANSSKGWNRLSPPAEVADWHNKALVGWETLKKTLDAEPEDAIADPFILFADSEVVSRFEEVEDALNDSVCKCPGAVGFGRLSRG